MASILIVDDVETDRAILGRIVTDAGHQAVFASDGDMVFEMLGKAKPALVFLDVVMPNANGFQTCRRVKADPTYASLPIVMVTAKSGESDQFWAKKQGADDYVVKPFKEDTIRSMIRKFVP